MSVKFLFLLIFFVVVSTTAQAGELHVGEKFKDCPACPEMIVMPQGRSQMGNLNDVDHRADEKPVRTINISYSFAVGIYEVTQDQWQEVMGNNPSKFQGQQHPVERVSWDDAQAFLNRLNDRLGLSSAVKKYRLLSEVEWEYVARAGTKTKWNCGNEESCLDDVAWYSYEKSEKKTHPVGLKFANSWGVYDMHGNVFEWTQDCWNESYNIMASDDCINAGESNPYRVLRGGSWFTQPNYLRSSSRSGPVREFLSQEIGFRIAKTL